MDPRGNSVVLRRELLIGLSVLPAAARAASPASAGIVDSVVGQAFAGATAERRDLLQTSPIFVGDLIGTGQGSRLAMTLGEITHLRLGADARITIDRFLVTRGGEMTLGLGSLLFERPEGLPPEQIRIRGPFGAIAVRGTQFFAGPSNNVFGVFVVRGRVSVSAAGRTVILDVGEGTDIPAPGAPPTTPARWGARRIDAALASVS